MSDDPLDQIFDSPKELEGELREKLAKMIVPFAVVDLENGFFHPKGKWHHLNAKQRVLVYFLARLALSTKNPEFKNALTPGEVEEGTELPGGTVRPKIAELAKDRVIFRGSDGTYTMRPTPMSLANAWVILEGAIPKTEKGK